MKRSASEADLLRYACIGIIDPCPKLSGAVLGVGAPSNHSVGNGLQFSGPHSRGLQSCGLNLPDCGDRYVFLRCPVSRLLDRAQPIRSNPSSLQAGKGKTHCSNKQPRSVSCGFRSSSDYFTNAIEEFLCVSLDYVGPKPCIQEVAVADWIQIRSSPDYV